MKNITLSPSRLSLFKECKRCFWLEVNKGVKRPEGIFASLPNGMDLILKKHFDECRCNNCLPVEIEGKLNGHLFDDLEKLKIWKNNLKGLEYIDEESGIKLRGALDDLFVTDDGFHIPIDFKTRGFPLKDDTAGFYQHQMDIYCFLLEKNGMKAGSFACLLFYYPTHAEGNGRFKFSVEIVKLKTNMHEGERLFKEAIKFLKEPEPEADENCPWCNWNRS